MQECEVCAAIIRIANRFSLSEREAEEFARKLMEIGKPIEEVDSRKELEELLYQLEKERVRFLSEDKVYSDAEERKENRRTLRQRKRVPENLHTDPNNHSRINRRMMPGRRGTRS